MTRNLGLDIGDKRIGIALSDPERLLASPFTIIERREETADIASITDIIDSQQVSRVIVGLPRSMDGSLGPQAQKVQGFIRELRQHINVPVEFRDERMTTVSARRLKREASTGKNRRKIRYDAIAAALILQGYLDEKY